MNLQHNELNPNDLIRFFGILFGALAGLWKYIDYRFAKDKLRADTEKADREEFITKVAKAAVEAALNSVLGDVKEDIQTLFKYREDDRKHIDKKFDIIMVEMKK